MVNGHMAVIRSQFSRRFTIVDGHIGLRAFRPEYDSKDASALRVLVPPRLKFEAPGYPDTITELISDNPAFYGKLLVLGLIAKVISRFFSHDVFLGGRLLYNEI